MAKDDTSGSSQKPVNTLHPAYSVTNVQTKIRTLDGTKVTYSSWIKLFKLHATAYKVSSHIDGTKAPESTANDYAEWKEIDALVLQWIWIYSTISDDILVRVLATNSTARDAWVKLEKIYLSNKKSRAAALETKFCNLTLAACSSLDDYCEKLKHLANQLEDVDHPVIDSHLVLQLIRGLPPEYDSTTSIINQTADVTWDLATSMLKEELIRQEARQNHSSTVLITSATPQPHSQTPAPNTSPTNNQTPNYYSQRGRGRGQGRTNRGGRGRGGCRDSSQQSTAYQNQ
uniref:uncharacterized protein LOC122597039 n=1 Tax=Erigeron canadensis TaxID=72917 RepID=UPI001CB8EE1F|nr:uncharacterized protein LOC122597039 [Erigeron canadensis]